MFLPSPPAPSCHRDDGSASLNACRIHGHLFVNKVAGNFHITVGKYVSVSRPTTRNISKGMWLPRRCLTPHTGSLLHRSIPHPRGHAHLAALVSHDSKVFIGTYSRQPLQHVAVWRLWLYYRGSWDDFTSSWTFVTPKISVGVLLIMTLVLIGCCSLQLLTPHWPSVLWRSYSWNHQPFRRHGESLCRM